MKVLMINSVCGIRSTGRICTDLARELEKRGHTVKIAYGRASIPKEYGNNAYKIGNNSDVALHGLWSRLNDSSGFKSLTATKKLIEWIKDYDPDVIHLHNLHGYYVNVPLLFSFLAESRKRVVWTLHDCWPFTGHCCYFEFAGCEKWKTGCGNCPQKEAYPASFTDRSDRNYERKKAAFCSLSDMTLVTPSVWMGNLVRQSFLNKYPVKTIHNWVDLNRFKKTDNDFKSRYGLEEKHIVLGVSSGWEKRKGLDDFILLRNCLGENYQIVLLGLNDKQLKAIPRDIIGLKQTDSVDELAQLYSAADVYVNPTWEDNFPTTNLEAIACGTPVVSYDTGGSGESAEMFGFSVQKGNTDKLAEAIVNIINGAGLAYPDLRKYNSASLSAYVKLLEGDES